MSLAVEVVVLDILLVVMIAVVAAVKLEVGACEVRLISRSEGKEKFLPTQR